MNSEFIIHPSEMDFTFLIIILLAIAFLLRVDFIFYIVYVCVGLYAWSRWVPARTLRQLKAQREYADHAFWGETVPVTIRLQNQSRLPIPWINFSESLATELTMGRKVNRAVSLRGKESARFSYEVLARRRGFYRLGPLRLTSGDLFGLFEPQQGYVSADTLTVYPRIIPLTQLGLPSRLPFGTLASRQRLFEDPTRPAGVRDYRSGDSLRQINWKASAHTRHLLVKMYQPAISLEMTVLLNLHSDDYDPKSRSSRVEWAIEVAASLATHLVEQRQGVGLITNGIDPLQEGCVFDEDSGRLIQSKTPALAAKQPAPPPAIPPRPGRAHLMKILERLARLESAATVPFDQWATTACLHLSWGVTILAITPRGDEATCQTLHRLVRAGFNPVLIAIEPSYNFGETRERARRLGFAAYNVSQLGGLDQWRRPQRMTV
ncbi:MAG: DUF58 domain-containing protein [Chloroflexi bacterium]|nr:DUF58 domain-containing protein [Chloroflexota bacterium]